MRPMLVACLALASLALPAAALASTPAMPAANMRSNIILSTGFTPVRVLEKDNIHVPLDVLLGQLAPTTRFVLALNVKQDGEPTDVHILKSENPVLDNSVVAAVRDFRFRPARLDHHTLKVPVHLTLYMRR